LSEKCVDTWYLSVDVKRCNGIFPNLLLEVGIDPVFSVLS
jgi:hypothetical protein